MKPIPDRFHDENVFFNQDRDFSIESQRFLFGFTPPAAPGGDAAAGSDVMKSMPVTTSRSFTPRLRNVESSSSPVRRRGGTPALSEWIPREESKKARADSAMPRSSAAVVSPPFGRVMVCGGGGEGSVGCGGPGDAAAAALR